jgi:hypothetical protein
MADHQGFSAIKSGFPRIFMSILIALFSGELSFAQYTNVLVSSQFQPNETSIYVNPKNVNQMIAGANLTSYYYSNDGGYTWGGGGLQSSLGVYGDPCVVIDTLGYFYYFHLSSSKKNSDGWLDQIVCQRSTNNGLSWNNGSGIGKNDPRQQDKEWAAVNPFNNELYVTWTQFDAYGVADTSLKSRIFFSKSSDQGITWSEPYLLSEISGNCIDSDSTVEGAVPTVGPDGEIYVSWAGPAGLVFDRSLDGGLTWLDHDIPVSDIPGGWDYAMPGIYRANGLPVTTCDRSNSPYKGTIYINWSDQRNGTDDTDIWLSRSLDGGSTWSAPIRVNDDLPGKQQFFTWMDVDQVTGFLWFVFYDRRDYPDTRTDVYVAVSTDGGNTFRNFKVSETPFIPNTNVFFGDYTCISAHKEIVRPIWTRLDGTDLSAYVAIIDSIHVSIPEPDNIPFAIEQNYPNPFTESTVFSFKIRKAGSVTLEVRDIVGKKVATLIDNEWLDSGKYLEEFNPALYPLVSGVYYFSLMGSNGLNRQQKMVYQK